MDELIAEAFSSETLRGFDRYYSSIAKLTNLWREKASAMMTAWQDVHDGQGEASEDTRLLGQRYPLSVSSGRWGSVEGAEEFLLERGRPLVEPVMLRVLSKFMKADTDTAADAVDAENVDAAAADPASAEAAPAAGSERNVHIIQVVCLFVCLVGCLFVCLFGGLSFAWVCGYVRQRECAV